MWLLVLLYNLPIGGVTACFVVCLVCVACVWVFLDDVVNVVVWACDVVVDIDVEATVLALVKVCHEDRSAIAFCLEATLEHNFKTWISDSYVELKYL